MRKRKKLLSWRKRRLQEAKLHLKEVEELQTVWRTLKKKKMTRKKKKLRKNKKYKRKKEVEEEQEIKKERLLKRQKHLKNRMKRRNKKRKSKKLKRMFQKEPLGDKRKKLTTLLLQRNQSAPINEQEDSDCFF